MRKVFWLKFFGNNYSTMPIINNAHTKYALTYRPFMINHLMHFLRPENNYRSIFFCATNSVFYIYFFVYFLGECFDETRQLEAIH